MENKTVVARKPYAFIDLKKVKSMPKEDRYFNYVLLFVLLGMILMEIAK